jgi:predicted aconitase with swiveling domain
LAKELAARGIVGGVANGELLATPQPISFWGGVDPATGVVIDPRHEFFKRSIAGKILAFPYGKGSSTGSLMILELARVGKAPAAIINIQTEPILATGPIVCRHFYGIEIPVVTMAKALFDTLQTGQQAVVDGSAGRVLILREPAGDAG